MAPAIIAVAETAQDVAEALTKFLGPVDDQSAEITALIGQCYSTSSALRKLDDKLGSFPYHRRYRFISYDLTTVKESLNHTFEDVHGLIGRLATLTYNDVWDDLCHHFRDESNNTLRRRLEIYCTVLEGLKDTLIDGSPRDIGDFEDSILKLERLLNFQHEKFVEAFNRLGVGGPVISRPTSFERRRPRDDHVPPPRDGPRADPHGAAGRGDDRRRDVDDDIRGPRRPPPAPEPPGSPTTSNTFSTQSSNLNSVLTSHWLPGVFDQSRPATPMEDTGQTSVFLADDMPGSSARLEEQGYVNLFDLPFENGDLLVRLYQRSDDGRSRFLCRTLRPARRRKDVVLPLVSLTVSRSGPFLKFEDIVDGYPELWACLKFPSFELMVLFFCAFLALRSEDVKVPMGRITDFEVHKEEELFAGRIVDDHYEHGLRLFQEKETGVVRLQASVQTGALKRKPIWTAFITHQILSPTWLSPDTRRVVHLNELQRYVFTDEYNPQMTREGAHELTFIESSDAREFVKVVRELVRMRRRGRRG